MEWRMSKGVVTKHGENEGRNFMRNGPPTLWRKSTAPHQHFEVLGKELTRTLLVVLSTKNNWGRRTFGTGSDVCGSTVSDMWVLVHRLPSHLPISNRHCIPRNFSDVKEKYARPSPRQQVLGGRDWSSCNTKLTGLWPKNCRELQGVQGDLWWAVLIPSSFALWRSTGRCEIVGLWHPRSVGQFHPLIGIGLPKFMAAELRRVSSLHASRAVDKHQPYFIHRKNVEGSWGRVIPITQWQLCIWLVAQTTTVLEYDWICPVAWTTPIRGAEYVNIRYVSTSKAGNLHPIGCAHQEWKRVFQWRTAGLTKGSPKI